MGRWLDQVPAVLAAWYPGQEGGRAIPAILFGDSSPSGKLPVTFLKAWSDSPAYGNYPGKNLAVNYAEGIYVGYRHFDKKNVEPLFAFGHGLSYTTFAYRDLKLPAEVAGGEPIAVSVEVENTGRRSGEEVVQLYVSDLEASVPVPIRTLAGFRRVALQPGERRTVSFTLAPRALSLLDAEARRVIEPGVFEVAVGGRQPGLAGAAEAATAQVLTGLVRVKGVTVAVP